MAGDTISDFIAGYVGGAAGIIVGSPMDVLKVRLQTRTPVHDHPNFNSGRISSLSTLSQEFQSLQTEGVKGMFRGILPPLLGLGFLNSILFVSYGQVLKRLNANMSNTNESLWKIYTAGFISGLACWIVSTPVEVIKCRAQVLRHETINSGESISPSFRIASIIFRSNGIRGLYQCGGITAARDAIGYGFYFAGYEGIKSLFVTSNTSILIAGGIGGCLSWFSIFPLDVVKSRMQTSPEKYTSTWDCFKKTYQEGDPLFRTRENIPLLSKGGTSLFWTGVGITMIRAFVVNAVTFFVYEWVYQWVHKRD